MSLHLTHATYVLLISKKQTSDTLVSCRSWVLFVSALLVLFGRSLVHAASLPSGFTETLVASGLASPTAMAFAPDGRLFICEQKGELRVIKNGALLPTPFVTLSVNSSGERGLLGVAFDPNFVTNHYVYIYYTTSSSPIHNRVSRFTANGDVAVAGSETVLLDLDNLSSATNHNGGAMHFGVDGKLYIAVGENATPSNAQTLSNLLGKILRINPDGTIPTSNPFYNTAMGKNRAIWAFGLRNPFTFAVQPETGLLYINDVGQNTWEEINEGIPGANYGWPATEGYTSTPAYTSPVYAYDHSMGCAITGGAFYNPTTVQFPSVYIGDYFFADYCGGWIKKYDSVSNSVANFASGIAAPVDLRVTNDGSLYYLSRGSGANTGAVSRVRYTASQPPNITVQPLAVYRPNTGQWLVDTNYNGVSNLVVKYGISTDIPVPGDYNGSGGLFDLAVYRRSTGQWLVDINRNGITDLVVKYGVSTDIPVPGDYDGDGSTDLAVYRRSSGQWFVDTNRNGVSDTVVQYGISTDIPVPGDYNGDAMTDFAVYRPSTGQWLIDTNHNGVSNTIVQYGISTDIPVPGDYDGDGSTDLAVYRRSSGQWFVDTNRNGVSDTVVQYGISTDIPVPGDYNEDLLDDVAVYRASSGQWFVDSDHNGMSDRVVKYGLSTDKPVWQNGWILQTLGLVP